ncbi:uncharacterized protein LOC135697269 [Ochlerotatus camptorhynchus]|uniref:uncharacterized protein LOC135697269 n=1 Tax=Ochlerotatus camptorhynchus TaxID=644619 RepID=UPI0031CF0711
MANLEKTNNTSLSDLQAEIAKLQIDTQACIEQIKTNAQATANIKVESVSKDQCAELEYKQEWAIFFPGLVSATTPVSQAPQELVELRQQVELAESRMTEYSESVWQLFDESVSTKWEDVNSARRRVSELRQQYLQITTELKRVRSTIEKDKQRAAEDRRRMADMIEYMKKVNVQKRIENDKLKQEAKSLDEEIGHLAGEFNILKSRVSMDAPFDEE